MLSDSVVDNIAYVHGWNEAARAHGAVTMVWLARLAEAVPGTRSASALRQVVSALASDPGLAMWKGADEPQANHISVSELAYAYTTVHGLDPQHLSVLVEAPQGSRDALAPYSRVTDIHGVDVYPVSFQNPRPSLRIVGDRTAVMASATPRHGVSTTLQICTSKSDGPNGQFVVPTYRQERFMAYDAIIHGARALFFFGGNNPHCFTETDAQLHWNWSYWKTLAPLIKQLGPTSPLHPVLVRPGTGIGVRSTNNRVTVISRTAAGQIWLIAENRSPRYVTCTLTGLPRGIHSAHRYPSGLGARITHRKITTSFKAWGVHVYYLPQQ